MLKVICEPATAVMRRLLMESFIESHGEDGTVFIVPDDEFAYVRALRWTKQAGVLHRGAIVGLPELTARIQSPFAACVISPGERLAILRQLLLEEPLQYDWLVGEKSAPHLTYGVLKRIGDALSRLQARDEAAEQAGESAPGREHPRQRQLRQLGERYRARLAEAGAIDARVWQRQCWATLDAARLKEALPPHQLIVLDGFTSMGEETMLALRCLRAAASDVLVLLAFNPEEDAERYSHLNAMYERLYDMADLPPVTDPQLLGAAAAAPGKCAAVEIVDAPTRTMEVDAMARYLRAQLDACPAGERFSYDEYVVAFPRVESYAPLVQSAFADYGLPWTLAAGELVLDHPLAKLLHWLRDAIASRAGLAELRQLLKSPFLPALLAEHGLGLSPGGLAAQLEALDRFRREKAPSSAGSLLVQDLGILIERLAERLARVEANMDPGDEEDSSLALLRGELDQYRQLRQTLESAVKLLESLRHPRGLQDWQTELRRLLDTCIGFVEPLEAGEFCGAGPLLPLSDRQKLADAHLLMVQAVQRICDCGTLVSEGTISFGAMLGVMRVLLRNVKLSPPAFRGDSFRVTNIAAASAHEAAVLLAGGLVDGDVPRYLAREARLDDNDGSLQQKQHISEQRAAFHSALRSARRRAILFVPGADTDSELLESQFVEELGAEWPGKLTRKNMAAFCGELQVTSQPVSVVMQQLVRCFEDGAKECPEALVNRRMSSTEAAILENIVHNLNAEQERRRSDALGNYDGFIEDPKLLRYLSQRAESHVHSVSQLDALVQCPFRYFVEYVLGVSEPEEEEERTASREAGILVHAILHSFYTEWIALGNTRIDTGNRGDAANLVLTHAQQELAAAKLSRFEYDCLVLRLLGSEDGAGLLPVNEMETGRAGAIRGYRGMLAAFLDLEVERSAAMGDDADMKPTFFELGFGLKPRRDGSQDRFSDSAPAVLNLPDGEQLKLRGRADRVDSGGGHFAVIDYKTGASPSITDQKHGYKVQLPVYLMALEQMLARQGRPLAPAGGMFMHVTPTEAEVSGQFFRKAFLKQAGIPSKRGMSDEEFEETLEKVLDRIAEGMSRIRRGRFHVTLAGERIACTYCQNASICRKDLARAERLVPNHCGG